MGWQDASNQNREESGRYNQFQIMRKSFLLFFVILFASIQIASAANWWDSNLQYRINSSIPDGMRPYPLSINLSNATGTNNATHIFLNGNTTNFSDLRFVLENTSLLPYYIENQTLANGWAKVWVNLTANGTVFLYYGNRTYSNLSNGETTFNYFDNFTATGINTTKWTVAGAGSNSSSGGALTLTNRRSIASKWTFGNNTFMRGRIKRGTDTSGEAYMGFETTVGNGDEFGMSNAWYYSYYSSPGYFMCIQGTPAAYDYKVYSTTINSNYNIYQINRGNNYYHCQVNDSETATVKYGSNIQRYLTVDAYSADAVVDYIFAGNYINNGPGWVNWSSNETSIVLVTYMPPTPIADWTELGKITNYFGTFTWTAGSGNITDNYNIKVNDNPWTNGSLNNYVTTYLTAHAWHNVTVQAYNSSGGGTLNTTSLTNNSQVPNINPVMGTVGDKRVYESRTITFPVNATDEDADTMFYNFSVLDISGSSYDNYSVYNSSIVHEINSAQKEYASTLFTVGTSVAPLIKKTGNFSICYDMKATGGSGWFYVVKNSTILPELNATTSSTSYVTKCAEFNMTLNLTDTFSIYGNTSWFSYSKNLSLRYNYSNLGSLNSSTGIYTWNTLTGQSGNYTLEFSGNDSYGGRDTTSMSITVQPTKTIPITLITGLWNSVLNNESQTMTSLNSIFAPTYIAYWNATTQVWEKYKSGWSYNQNKNIPRGAGYKLKVFSNKSIDITITDTFDWNLSVGQNLIGVPENVSMSWINSTVNYAGGCTYVDELNYYIPENNSLRTYTCSLNSSQANASVQVLRGRALWINALQAVNITDVI